MVLRVIPILALALSCAAPAAAPPSGRAPERVLFDTDVGGDIDDAGALAVLHGLADRPMGLGKTRVLEGVPRAFLASDRHGRADWSP